MGASDALLHQHQRRVRTVTHRGRPLRYIEVEAGDIELANRLAHEVLGRTLDELPPQTRRLLTLVREWAVAEAERLHVKRGELRFTRRQIRAATGWGDTQLKVHLSRLAELEYVLIHRVKAGQGYEYELLWDGEGEAGDRFVMGLSAPDAHAYDGKRSGAAGRRSAPGRGLAGGQPVGGRLSPKLATPAPRPVPGDMLADLPETHVGGMNGNGSYPQVVPSILAARAAGA